jgi:hypothetical protein
LSKVDHQFDPGEKANDPVVAVVAGDQGNETEDELSNIVDSYPLHSLYYR